MRKLIVVAVIAFAACVAQARSPRDDDPKHVPDAGSTALMLGAAFTGLALLARKVRPAQ